MANDSLFAAAPSFDQPLAVLKHCHDRIRKQLNTLNKLQAHLLINGADQQAQEAARAILRYFTQAAPLHHEDEEEDLLPALQSSVSDADRASFEAHHATIMEQHQTMAQLWEQLKLQLQAIEASQNTALNPTLVEHFNRLYSSHMEIEENHIAPLAARTLSVEQFASMSLHMQQRRGVQAH